MSGNPAHKGMFSTIVRLGKETGRVVRDTFLDNVGLAVADIRVALLGPTLFEVRSRMLLEAFSQQLRIVRRECCR